MRVLSAERLIHGEFIGRFVDLSGFLSFIGVGVSAGVGWGDAIMDSYFNLHAQRPVSNLFRETWTMIIPPLPKDINILKVNKSVSFALARKCWWCYFCIIIQFEYYLTIDTNTKHHSTYYDQIMFVWVFQTMNFLISIRERTLLYFETLYYRSYNYPFHVIFLLFELEIDTKYGKN